MKDQKEIFHLPLATKAIKHQTSLMVQWLRNLPANAETEFDHWPRDSTCHMATKSMNHNYLKVIRSPMPATGEAAGNREALVSITSEQSPRN